MKLKFKDQNFQIEAVNSVVKCFNGQITNAQNTRYRRDVGTTSKDKLAHFDASFEDDTGYKNADIIISDAELLANINSVQKDNNLIESTALIRETKSKDPDTKKLTTFQMGRCILDVEMETGTGKTYVYIRTMFELSKQYGWNKFIVVTPSTAVREGVKKTFEITAEHFMEHYQKKARFFVYDSNQLTQIDDFSRNNALEVMIINNQAFGAKDEKSRRIYDARDDFQGRKPIDVLAANHPIIILDEPQELGGPATQKGLARFNPLFLITYSATHRDHHNTVYALDAVDAYNKRLVKKIAVKALEVSNINGQGGYLFAESIVTDKVKEPRVRLSFDVLQKNGIVKGSRLVKQGDNLYHLSNNLKEYKDNYVISDVNVAENTIHFLNGIALPVGTVTGDTTEETKRRIQIRETIASHIEKEAYNFQRGIKTLSLFFIDEVAKYRQYDESGEPVPGEYAKVFEEEYTNYLAEHLDIYQKTPYGNYLKKHVVDQIHSGYFSIDKKGHMVNSTGKKANANYSDDISAYDLILKNKERLLSFEEPVRFIFSHSALGIGWDNPNVFQICTLKESSNAIKKHQEVGRGLRLCVNSHGERIDGESVDPNLVQEINKLTVITSDSYKEFTTQLQAEIREDLYERPDKITVDFLKGKTLRNSEGEKHVISADDANRLNFYLISNQYVDEMGKLTEKYRSDVNAKTMPELPNGLQSYQASLDSLLSRTEVNLPIETEVEPKIKGNPINPDNFYKREFQNLWRMINRKSIYLVDFDSSQLIENARIAIDEKLQVSKITYRVQQGEQHSGKKDNTFTAEDYKKGSTFIAGMHENAQHADVAVSTVAYDLLGSIAHNTSLTRKTVAEILKQISNKKFELYKLNPEGFIQQISNLINDEKATLLVKEISYNLLDDTFDDNIFTLDKRDCDVMNAFKAKKHIQDYVFTDGYAKNGDSIEMKFVKGLDTAAEVCVYAKLPSGFSIPTPMGNYSPDWAIAFNEGTVRRIYFVAETKGSLSSLQLKTMEKSKIDCAKKWFSLLNLENKNVKYDVVTSFQDLMRIVNGN